jgi:hypothetical protein
MEKIATSLISFLFRRFFYIFWGLLIVYIGNYYKAKGEFINPTKAFDAKYETVLSKGAQSVSDYLYKHPPPPQKKDFLIWKIDTNPHRDCSDFLKYASTLPSNYEESTVSNTIHCLTKFDIWNDKQASSFRVAYAKYQSSPKGYEEGFIGNVLVVIGYGFVITGFFKGLD